MTHSKKKLYFILSYLAFVLLFVAAFAQRPVGLVRPYDGEPKTPTLACGTDTIEYGLLKASQITRHNLSTGNVEGYAQWYEALGTLTIRGVSFYAGVSTPDTTNRTADVRVSVYNSSLDSLPFGPALATTTITVDTNFRKIAVPFILPAVVNGNYLVVVEYGNGLLETETVSIGLSADGDGLGESLGSGLNDIGGNDIWLPFENFLGGADRDALIFPWVEYSLTAGFTSPGDSICIDQTVSFINTSTWIASHRMYNLRIFDAGTYGDAFSWSFGDGSISTDESPMHSYSLTGNFSVLLTANISGYHSNCSEPIVKQVTAMDRPISAFSVNNTTPQAGDTLFFTDLSSGGANCIWDFGDSTVVQGCGNQIYAYDSAGTYTVMLTVESPYGCAEVYSMVIMVSQPTGIFGYGRSASHKYQIFPNPSSGKVYLKWDQQDAKPEKVFLMDLRGGLVEAFDLGGTGGRAILSLNHFPRGLYILKLETPEQQTQSFKVLLCD